MKRYPIKNLIIIIVAVFLLGAGYANKTVLASTAEKLVYHSSCDTPIPYRLGTIDARFNISRDEFATSIQEANNIWSTAEGRTLFAYDPKARLTISLTYDERQSLNRQINQLDTDLKEKNNSLKPGISEYERRSATFKGNLAALNQEIDSWNAKGGAPADEYNKLKERQAALQQEADALNAMAKNLNLSADQYNSGIQELNQTVDTYNETLKGKPEEGIYIADPTGERIIIYFYNTHQELVHTLAHEMGHALTIDHNANQASIMFSKTNNAIALSPEDQAGLTEACRKRSVLETTRAKLAILISQIQQRLQQQTGQ